MNADQVDADEATAALTADFSETARNLFSPSSVQETLDQVVSLAVATIEGCDFAGIFLIAGDKVTTPALTDPIVADIDALQHSNNEGPCLDAISARLTFYAHDLDDDPRWPHFGPEATTRGIRSALALPLFTHDVHGALNLYARYPHAFNVIDRARGLLLAGLAAPACSAAQSQEAEESRALNLHAALDSRKVIGQAQGILIEREHVTADQAFEILRRASQHLNLKLRDVAQTLVDTGEKPDTGPQRSPHR